MIAQEGIETSAAVRIDRACPASLALLDRPRRLRRCRCKLGVAKERVRHVVSRTFHTQKRVQSTSQALVELVGSSLARTWRSTSLVLTRAHSTFHPQIVRNIPGVQLPHVRELPPAKASGCGGRFLQRRGEGESLT